MTAPPRALRARPLAVGARVLALGATALLLLATSAIPESCPWLAPRTYRATGTCGPGGIVVVEVAHDNQGRPRIVVHNAAALGLAAAEGGPTTTAGFVCLSSYDEGGWAVTGFCGGAVPGGGFGGSGFPPAGGSCRRSCTAAASLSSGLLEFTCTGSDGGCASVLTPIE